MVSIGRTSEGVAEERLSFLTGYHRSSFNDPLVRSETANDLLRTIQV